MSSYGYGYGNPHVGDVKTRFKLTMQDDQNGTIVTLDISADYDTYKMEFLKPDGDSVIVTASLFTDGTDGVIKYDSNAASFLDIPGSWKRRGIISHSSNGNYYTGSWVEFYVDE